MKRSLHVIVVWLSIGTLMTAADVAKAGPFRDFFRGIRNAVAPPPQSEKPRPHRRSHKHNETPPSDASNSQTSESPIPAPSDKRDVPAPSDKHDVRWAKAAPGANQQKTDLPYGTPVAGKPGLVTSPFTSDSSYVDVTGFPPGTAVEDPYTGKVFLTP